MAYLYRDYKKSTLLYFLKFWNLKYKLFPKNISQSVEYKSISSRGESRYQGLEKDRGKNIIKTITSIKINTHKIIEKSGKYYNRRWDRRRSGIIRAINIDKKALKKNFKYGI